MKLIAITPEVTQKHELEFIMAILDSGFSYVHLRKPSFSIDELRQYLSSVPAEYHSRLKLHSHFELAAEFAVGGVHLNHRFPSVPSSIPTAGMSISRSCHSFAELKNAKSYHYAFLSPIFDSISKPGYESRFSCVELQRFFRSNPLCNNIVALGGVTPEYLRTLKISGLAGAAFLGYLFNAADASELKTRLLRIKSNL